MYRNNYIICILFLPVPVLCFSRPRETDKSKTKRGEHCEEAGKSIWRVLQKLLAPWGLIPYRSNRKKISSLKMKRSVCY